MRSVYLTILSFMMAAVVWIFYAPVVARVHTYAFADAQNDVYAIERELLLMGSAAHPALLEGLNHTLPSVRVHCAHVLALQGDRRGDTALLTLLREHSNSDDSMGALAESYLCHVWRRRESPSESLALKLSDEDSFVTDGERLKALSDTLTRNPLWATGYVLRASVHLRNGSIHDAWRDVLLALELEPDHFEAMIILGDCQLLVGAPEQAYLCYQQAVRINPRLRRLHQKTIREILKAIEVEKARQRRERRRDLPLT